MRKTAILPVLLATTVSLCLAQAATAAPVVTLKAKAVPISGFPHTGNILGAGAAVQAEFTITGTEYGGFPPPLIGVTFYLPKGAKIHSQGFKTCSKATLEQSGPAKCPRGSAAGPIGHAQGVVAFGNERVREEVSIASFFTPNGLLFYTEGHSPVQLEFLSAGKYVNLAGAGGFGPKLVTTVPLVETVPGAPDASVEKINVKVGTAMKSHGKTIYYGTMPKKCPKGGFPVKAELTFAGLGGLSQQTVPAKYKAPCPRGH
ncbi:MAG: hypothetical protein QOI89_1089 [Solirubrobacteraceae bacterium]|jgi:hypothetical protein|nr:hypothetical protein [Solirubrobacteraceae bacterium]